MAEPPATQTLADAPAGRPRRPIRLKLALVAGVLAIVPVIVVGVTLMDVNARAIERTSRELQLAAGEIVALEVGRAFRDAQDALSAVAAILTEPGLDDGIRESALLREVGGRAGIDHVAIYDADGALIDTIVEGSGPGRAVPSTLPPAIRTRAESAEAGGGGAIAYPGGPRVPWALPVRVDQRTTAFVATWVSLEAVQAEVERLGESRFGTSKDALFVVDGGRRVLAHPDAGLAESLAALEHPLLAGGPGVALGQTRPFVDGAGATWIGTTLPVSGTDWRIVVQQPEATAYRSLTQMRSVVLSAIGVTVALALALALSAARHLTRPIDALSSLARELAERRFDATVDIRTRDELQLLGEVMTGAARALKASEAQLNEEAAIRADLGRYLPADLVEQVVNREQDMGLGGVRRSVTVLFADVVAFTPLTARLSAENVVALLNELFTILTGIVFRHEGTVDKFVGDCLMAIWGAPRPDGDHAERALAAAEDMLRWLEAGNAGWEARFGVRIELAIGVSSGEAVVGNIGSESRMEYTAIGEVVNLAARLEAIARPNQILVSPETRRLAGDAFEYRSVGPQKVAGRSEPVELFEVLG